MVYPKGKNTVYPVLPASNIIYIFKFAKECMFTEIQNSIPYTNSPKNPFWITEWVKNKYIFLV